MKRLLCAVILLVLSGCYIDAHKPRRFELNLLRGYEVCYGICSRREGVENITAKIITGTPTELTVTCTCKNKFEEKWTRVTK